MPQLAQRLGLDLADAFARNVELLADLLEGMRLAVLKAEAHTQDLLLTRREGGEDILELLTQKRVGCLLGRLRSVIILNEVAEMTVLFFADRRLKGDRLLRDLHDLLDLGNVHVQLLGDLFGGRLAAKRLDHAVRGAQNAVNGLDHMYRDADGAGLIDWRIHQVA